MNFMMHRIKRGTEPVAEPEAGRPAGAGEQWLEQTRNRELQFWERLNPRSRGIVRIIAVALALQQTHAQLPEPLRARLSAAISEIDRLATRMRALMAEVARQTPPGA
jgi:type II secretory pathway component PulM